MSVEDNGLTLQGLAHKLETQAQKLEALERENAELRTKVATLEGSGTRRSEVPALRSSDGRGDEEEAEPFEPEEEERMSRRRMLSRAGAAVAGIVVAGALTQRDIREAKADIIRGSTDQVHRGGVEGTSTNLAIGYGVWGNSSTFGVYGTGNHAGVKGESSNRAVEGYGGRRGVYGRSFENVAVEGDSNQGTGVFGHSYYGTGVYGSSTTGYGGWFEGGKAQLKLKPADSPGKPGGAHSKGEIYMDKAGALFVCVRGGNPATWRRVTTTAV